MVKKVTIVGGHGNVALRLARLLSQSPCDYSVTSLVRDGSHAPDIVAAGATALVVSLEEASVADLVKAFTGQDVIVFSAGAGGKGGEARTKKVDYEGAVKVFDAIEGVDGDTKPRLILVSAVHVLRDPSKMPPHYVCRILNRGFLFIDLFQDDQDKVRWETAHQQLRGYLKWKGEADKDLARRTGFEWTIVRPGGLSDASGIGKASIGRTHLVPSISVGVLPSWLAWADRDLKRDDVAEVLALLVDREDAGGLGIDVVGGDRPIGEGLDAFLEKGETDFLD